MTSSAATAARHKLEDETRSIVWNLVGGDPSMKPAARAVEPSGGRSSRSRKRAAPPAVVPATAPTGPTGPTGAGEAGVGIGVKRQKLEPISFACGELAAPARLEFTLRAFVGRLPTNHGAQLCLEELFSFLRSLRTARAPTPPPDSSSGLIKTTTSTAPAPASDKAPAPGVDKSTTGDKAAAPATDKAMAAPGADKVVSVPGADKAMAVPGADKAMTVPGADKAMTVPGADKAMAAPGADKAMVMAGADKAMGVGAADKAMVVGGERDLGVLGVDEMLEAAGAFCDHPPFAACLAAFGRLPDHPYLLVFDPHAYQNATPAALDAADALRRRYQLRPDVSISLPRALSAPAAEAKAEHLRELELQEQSLVLIFNEEHRPSGLRCFNCRETKYLNVWTIQARSADEGSSYIYHCLRCHEIGRTR